MFRAGKHDKCECGETDLLFVNSQNWGTLYIMVSWGKVDYIYILRFFVINVFIPHTHTLVHVYVNVPCHTFLHASCKQFLLCRIFDLHNAFSKMDTKQYKHCKQINNTISKRTSLLSSSSLFLRKVFKQNHEHHRQQIFVLDHLQLECVEHLEADFSNVIFILVTDLLQKPTDGIKHFLSILKIWATAVQHACMRTHTSHCQHTDLTLNTCLTLPIYTRTRVNLCHRNHS